MGAISHIKSITIGDGTNTDIVRPSDWNSIHNQYLTITGNTANASIWSGSNLYLGGGNNIGLSITGDTLSFNYIETKTLGGNTAGASTLPPGFMIAGGNGITLSANASTLSIVGNVPYTVSSYVPYEAAGLASASVALNTATSGQVSFWPISINDYVAVDRVNLIVSMNIVSSTNSGRQTAALFYGLYTRGTGASTSLMSRLTSASLGWSVTNSSGSFTISQATSSNSAGYTYSSISTSNSSSNSLWIGNKMLQIPIGSTLSPGVYWVGMLGTGSTSSSPVGVFVSLYGVSMTFTNLAPMGSASSAFSSGTNQLLNGGQGEWLFGQGIGANTGALPASAAFSAVSNGAAIFPLMKFWS